MFVAAIWEPLAAFGTLALAGATAWLARQGRDQIRAQWRPVLVVDETGGFPGIQARPDGTLILTVQNVGRGPALDVAGVIDIGTRDGLLASPRFRPLAPGSYLPLSWSDPSIGETDVLRGWVDYQDVTGVAYRTWFDVLLPLETPTYAPLHVISQNVERVPPPFPRWLNRVPPRVQLRYLRSRYMDNRVDRIRNRRPPVA